jgi:hypothetical protein
VVRRRTARRRSGGESEMAAMVVDSGCVWCGSE